MHIGVKFFARVSLLLGPWEFWPYSWVYPLVFLRYLGLCVRFRRLDWLSAVNPGIEYGGLFGYRKSDVLKTLPAELVPHFEAVESALSFEAATALIDRWGSSFPLILKPEVGERGIGVRLLRDRAEALQALTTIDRPHLLQEYCKHPFEYGVFVIRYPGESELRVVSVCDKRFMEVTGDGIRSVRQLLMAHPRFGRYVDRADSTLLDFCPKEGEVIRCQPIGNHNRGTVFLDARDRIDTRLVERMQSICSSIKGFHYGRFDLRAESWEALLEGRAFCIIELNGVASEPTHIYTPGFSFLEAQRTLWQYWGLMARIARHNGPAPPRSTTRVWADFKAYRKAVRQA